MSKRNRRKRERKRDPGMRTGRASDRTAYVRATQAHRLVTPDHPAGREIELHIDADPVEFGASFLVGDTSGLDQDQLHPSLRGLGPDSQIDVILTPGPGREPPPGAGELLGTLRKPIQADDGTILPEGSAVWQDTRHGSFAQRAEGRRVRGRVGDRASEIAISHDIGIDSDIVVEPEPGVIDIGRPGPGSRTAIAGGPYDEPRVVADYRAALEQGAVPAAFRARKRAAGGGATEFVQALEDESEGLAARLSRGLSAEELKELAPQIARAASIGGVNPGQYSFTTDEEPDIRISAPGGGEVVITGPPPAPRDSIPSKIILGGERTDGGEGLPFGMQPGDIIAAEQPLGYVATDIVLPAEGEIKEGDRVWRPRISPQARVEEASLLGPVTAAVLERVRHIEAGDPAILALRASEVLAMHTDLADLMSYPTEEILRFYHWFIERTINDAHAQGGAERAREYWEGMFWPATTAQEWTTILARLLRSARTYQITAEMVDKVTQQYEEDLAAGWYAVDEDDLPWPAGFAWLDAPLTFTDKLGKEGWNRAVSWGQEYLALGSRNAGDSRRVPGARIVTWSWHDDHDSYWSETTGARILSMGGLGMAHAISFPYNARLNVRRDAQGRATQDDTIRWVRTLWKVLSSEISATRTTDHIERHVRKRALKSLRHGEVVVVTLRRKHYVSDGEGGHQARIYTCQWPVNGFWRHSRRDADWEETHIERDENGRRTRHHAVPDEFKECCGICGAPVSWVGTYTKGPAGAPWKDDANRTVYRLAR